MPEWNTVRAEYISTNISQRDIAKKYGIPYTTLRDRATKEQWKAERDKATGKAVAEAAQKVAQTAADNAVIAERIKTKLLKRLEREIDALPEFIGTEKRGSVIEREQKLGKAKTTEQMQNFRLRDFTAAYKDLTEDYRKGENGDVEDLTPLVDLLK